jgi:two-component system sensor histidine kinase/response regulator
LPKRVIAAWRKIPEIRRGYLVAFISVVAASIAVLLLRQYLDRSIFILFAAPIVMASWYAGRGPALLAIALGVVAADLVFLDRRFWIVPVNAADVVAIGIYVIVGLTIVHLTDLIRRARADAQGYAAQLENQAMEMELQQAELEQQIQEAQDLREELEAAHHTLKTNTTAQLAEAQALARLGSWEWNITDNTLEWSDEMYRLYGLVPGEEQITFDRFQSLLHPEDREVARDIIGHALETGEPFSFDHRVIRPDGAERIFHGRGKVVLNASGQSVRMLGTGQDVTESRRAEAALRTATEYAAKQQTAEAAARHLNRVFAQAPVLIAVMKGPDHVVEQVNQKGLELIGDPDVVGKPMAEGMPRTTQLFGPLLDEVYRTGQPFIGRELSPNPDDPEQERRYFNFVFQPLSEDDRAYGILVVASEVTDLVQSRLNAEKAHQEAINASRAKSDFLARMSHELRTPLAAIIGYGELLADGITGPVNEEQTKQLTRIRWSANHLLSIIDEILTLARMEAGKEKVDFQDVEVPQLLESVASMAEPLAAAKGLSFEMIPPDEITVETDPMKLRQVLLNLISNAVKYTDKGSVSLASERRDGVVEFFVKDTGVGVAEEHLEKIFEPFWQVEQTTTRRSGGTGLGLAVTRQFVELIGGRISVDSRLGAGSIFTVTVPVRRAE